MSHRYKKHPKYIGKSLTIQRGRQDKLVKDHEILEGREWEKFVVQGFLVPVDEQKEKKEAPPKPPTSSRRVGLPGTTNIARAFRR